MLYAGRVFVKSWKSRSENEKPEMANFHLHTPHSINLKVKGNAYIYCKYIYL